MKNRPYHKLIKFLKENKIKYCQYQHEKIKTSLEASKVRPDFNLSQGAKAMILSLKSPGLKNVFALFVLPGDKKINSKKIKSILNYKEIRFATEEEISKITGGIEIGGIHPFGNLFEIPVYVDVKLMDNEKIIFNAGDRGVSISLKLKDYLEILNPNLINFSK